MKKIIKAFSIILVIAFTSNKTNAQLASEAPAPTASKVAELQNKNAATSSNQQSLPATASSVAPGTQKTTEAVKPVVVTADAKSATLSSNSTDLKQSASKPAANKAAASGSVAPDTKKEEAKPVAKPTGAQSVNG